MSVHDHELLQLLRELEVELHRPTCRCDPARYAAVLDPEFREIGRSGAAYTRDDILQSVRHNTDPDALSTLHADQFHLTRLGQTAALLTYRTIQDGGERPALRSSLWRRDGEGRWRLVFHQGTPTRRFDEGS